MNSCLELNLVYQVVNFPDSSAVIIYWEKLESIDLLENYIFLSIYYHNSAKILKVLLVFFNYSDSCL